MTISKSSTLTILGLALLLFGLATQDGDGVAFGLQQGVWSLILLSGAAFLFIAAIVIGRSRRR